jgi:hypothetical protein
MMAINHRDHDHPNTPAARAACRKQTGQATITGRLDGFRDPKPQGVPMTVVPRKRGDGGVVKGMKAAGPGRTLMRKNSLIKAEYDLGDMPRMLAYGVRLAWAADLDVRAGDPFNEAERRVVIEADRGTISLVWKENRPDGIWAIWIKNYDNSKQWKIDSVQEALEIMHRDSHEAWDEFGNFLNA